MTNQTLGHPIEVIQARTSMVRDAVYLSRGVKVAGALLAIATVLLVQSPGVLAQYTPPRRESPTRRQRSLVEKPQELAQKHTINDLFEC